MRTPDSANHTKSLGQDYLTWKSSHFDDCFAKSLPSHDCLILWKRPHSLGSRNLSILRSVFRSHTPPRLAPRQMPEPMTRAIFDLLARRGYNEVSSENSPGHKLQEVGALAAYDDAERHRRRNFVPKLDSIEYYHATCNCVRNEIIVRQGTAR